MKWMNGWESGKTEITLLLIILLFHLDVLRIRRNSHPSFSSITTRWWNKYWFDMRRICITQFIYGTTNFLYLKRCTLEIYSTLRLLHRGTYLHSKKLFFEDTVETLIAMPHHPLEKNLGQTLVPLKISDFHFTLKVDGVIFINVTFAHCIKVICS